MMKPTFYVFLFNEFVEWEVAYLMPGLIHSGKAEVVTFSLDGKEVTSAGNLHVRPDISAEEVKIDKNAILILPGGYPWERKEILGMESIVKAFFDQGKAIGAICAATTYLAQLGYLDEIPHTSNGLDYLKQMAPDYNGDVHYRSELAVTGRNVITASGTGALEFAKAFFELTHVFSDKETEEWYRLFKN